MKEVKVFTVSSFNDDIVIEKYLKTVTYHVVIGMNFFADFMQSFTDVFGGKSESYQKRLREINTEVINGIKQEVHKVGGNCAIDLKIDNDEISAKGKSMIMVTAIATAVAIKADTENTSTKSIDLENALISNEEIAKTLEIINLINRFPEVIERKILLNALLKPDISQKWDIEHKKLMTPVKSLLIKCLESGQKLGGWKESLIKLYRLFSSQEKQKFMNQFCNDIFSRINTDNVDVVEFYLNPCIEIINKESLIDSEQLLKYCLNDNIYKKIFGLTLLKIKKEDYSRKDFDNYNKIRSYLISETQSEEGDEKVIQHNNFLTHKTKINTYIQKVEDITIPLDNIFNT